MPDQNSANQLNNSGPITIESAIAACETYRNGGAIMEITKAIIFQKEVLPAFINDVIIPYADEVTLPEGFEWKISITPICVKVDSKVRLTTCILPIIVHTTDANLVYDFFDTFSTSSVFKDAYKLLLDKVVAGGYVSFIYDEAQLWP